MKLHLTTSILLLSFASAGGLRAADYIWNQWADQQPFENPANWLVGDNPAISGPGANDNILTPKTVTNPDTGNPDVGSGVWITGDQQINNLTLNLTLGWGFTASNSDASLTIRGDVTKSGSVAMYFGNSIASDSGITTPGGLSVHVLGNFTNVAGAFQVGNQNRGIESFVVEGLTTVEAGTLTFRGPDVQLKGGLHIAGGQVIAYFGSGSGGFSTSALTGTGTIRPSSSFGSTATVTVNGASGTASFGGLLADQNSTDDPSTLALVKSGASVQKLSRASGSTYTGGTVVSGGTLLVSNTTGSGLGYGAVEVQSGGILGGTGLIALQGEHSVTVESGGILSAGDEGIGTLRLSGANTTGAILTLEDGARLSFDLGGGNASDTFQFSHYTGAEDFLRNGVVTLDFQSAQVGTFTLFKAFSDTGSTLTDFGFDALSSGFILGLGLDGFEATWDYSTAGQINLVVSQIPEPSSILLIGAAGIWPLLRRRRLRSEV